MTKSVHLIERNGIEWSYTLYRKDVKNINLRINQKSEIVVSANKRVSIEKINQFIYEKWDWIDQAKRKIAKRNSIQDFPEQIDSVRFLGKVYPLVIRNGHSNLQIQADHILITTTKTDIEKVIVELRKLLEKEFIKIIDSLKEKYNSIIANYGVEEPSFKFRYMKGKWGSCEVRKKVITISYNLMFYPIEAVEYVLWHEYAHLIVPNHSKRFHQLIQLHMPNYKIYESFLK